LHEEGQHRAKRISSNPPSLTLHGKAAFIPTEVPALTSGAAPYLDAVALEIAWGRVRAVIDEAEATLIRTSFSPLVREACDFGVLLLDASAGSVAQSQRSMPSFVGTLPRTLRAGLERFPPSTWRPGDVFATNDPWLGTGHLPDMTAVRPIFRGGRPIAYAGCIAHWSDVGGAIWSADTNEVFEEGLRLPPCKLVDAGTLNEDIASIVLGNVRLPEQVLGDLHAQLATMEVTERRLLELLDDLGLDDPAPLFAAVQGRTEAAMRAAIAELPDGTYGHEIEIDGVREPLLLRVGLTVAGEAIEIDWEGTSPQADRGINETYNHAYAMSVYPIKCLLSPDVPNNEGAYRPITMRAPEGCLVNASYPAPVASRQLIGHYISAVVMGALAHLVPERVLADSGSPTFRIVFTGIGGDGKKYGAAFTLSGGMGARAEEDGLSAAPFPSNSGATSIEMVEAATPLVVRRRELRADSGGPGRFRGGLGVDLDFELHADRACTVSVMTDRVHHAPAGRFGGEPGAPNVVQRASGELVNPKARTELRPGERMRFQTAGGGGYGAAPARDPALVQRDLEFGYVTPAADETPGETPDAAGQLSEPTR
ncbi:MAG: hydantoinase B/oxoprolinase family protein, partial [Actinomycetia bacterium]|nr:hydantoinase B/oxoprolinase family protein [Actinomycetes bacterium]